MRTTALVPSLICAVALSACGGSAADTTSPAAALATTPAPVAQSPSPSPSPSPTPTEPTTEQAGAQYLAIVAPYNEALNALYDYLDTTGDLLEPDELATALPMAASLADANRAFGIALQQAAWPVAVQSTVDDLAAGAAAEQADIRNMALADDVDEFLSADDSFAATVSATSGVAELLRQKLGLPETKGTQEDE